MFTRLRIVVALMVTIGAATLGAGHQVARAADRDVMQLPQAPAVTSMCFQGCKSVTLSPTSGPVGTVVTGEIFDAPPNDPITVILKIPGDPVLATGTTDATGYAKFTFTIPYVVGGGAVVVFFTDFKCACQIGANFTVTQGIATPIPTATPTRTPTPPSTPTQASTPLPTATPTATATPRVPVLGSGQIGGGGGPNVGILAFGFLAVVTVLSWFAATRRRPDAPAMAWASPLAAPVLDYSTDLDMATLEALRRPFPVTVEGRAERRGLGWAIGSGLAAVAGLALLRRK